MKGEFLCFRKIKIRRKDTKKPRNTLIDLENQKRWKENYGECQQ